MVLYSTELLIENVPVPYQVYREGVRLFFKPSRTLAGNDVKVFWVEKKRGHLEPHQYHGSKIH